MSAHHRGSLRIWRASEAKADSGPTLVSSLTRLGTQLCARTWVQWLIVVKKVEGGGVVAGYGPESQLWPSIRT